MPPAVAPRRGTRLAWAAAALACAAAFCVLDLVVDAAVFLAGVVVAPLLTALRVDRRTTAVVAVAAIVMAILAVAVSPGEDNAQRAVSISLAGLGSLVAVRFAGVREGRERTARWLAAQQEVARIGAEGAPLEEAAPRMLRAIGQALAWDVALLWERDRAAGVLRCVTIWHAPGRDVTAFERLVAEREFPRGRGLPGEVWARQAPAWIDDVADRARYTRAEAAVASGLRTGFAFPTLAGDDVLGVIEAYTSEPRVPDRDLIEIMSTFGTQMGQYIEALRAHEAVRAGEAEVRRSRDGLSATLGNLADAVTVQDRDGRLVYANQAAARMLGLATAEELLALPPEQVLARFEVFDEHGRPLDAAALPGWRTLAGERPGPMVIRFRSVTAGDDRWAIVKSTAVRDRDGEVVRAVNVVEDITEQKRAEIAQRFLAEASRLLGASLDYATTLNSVAEVAVPSFADWCAVDVVGDDGMLRRVAVAHSPAADGERMRAAMAPHAPGPDADHPVAEVIRTGQALLLRDPAAETGDGEGLAQLRAAGIRSAMIVPLPAWRRVLGAISFVNAESARAFDEHDLALAEEVGRRAATAMENARLYGELAEVARTLQQSLLPPHLPEIAGLDVAARYRPAGEGIEVGGDFYDLFDTGDARWAVLIGDVCGKGADAAATTALARYTLRAAAMRERRPGRVLEQLNEAMLRQRADRQFCTVAYASVDVGAHGAVLTLACGGHPPPLIVRREGGVEVAPAAGTLLGVVDDPELAEATVELAAGDALVLYTDGVTETRTPDGLFGLDGLVAAAGAAAGQPAAEVARRVEAAAAAAGEVRDDLALVVLRVPEGPEGVGPAPAVAEREPLDVFLPSSPEAIRSARQALDRLALDVGEQRLEELRLLVSEVVTNALRHGSRGAEDWIGLRARRAGDVLRVEVTDAGPGFEARVREAAPDATGGWGLYLVERLSERWGVGRGERTTVWFEVALR